MEVVVTTGAIGQSNHHHQQTNTNSFLQAGSRTRDLLIANQAP